MRVTSILCLCLGAAMILAHPCIAQDEKPPDYTRQPLGKWIEAMQDEGDAYLRNEARCALGPDGPYAKVAIPALINALKDRGRLFASEAAQTLADYGPSVVPRLLHALKRPEAPVRAGVALALGYVTPKAIEAIPSLIDTMKDSAPEVRAAAAWSLSNIGRPAHKAIPALISALQDRHAEVREAVALALREMGRKSKPALPALILALKDESERVRRWSAEALGHIGPDARVSVPALIDALQNKKDKHARSTFAQALGEIGPAAKEAVPALLEALREKDDFLNKSVVAALGDIGPGAKAAVPALIEVAKDKGNGGRWSAMGALGKIGPDAKEAVPILLEALDTREPLAFRCTVADALGGMGAAAKTAVPALTAIARDRFAYGPARKAAAEAVMKIDPEFAAKQGMESAYLDVRLGKVPAIKVAARGSVTEEQNKHIKELIARLAEVKDPDLGMSATLTGDGFAPLPGHDNWGAGLLTDHRLQSADALRSLVEIGPDALPYLLEALEDKTPTKLKVEHRMAMGMLMFGTELGENPVNPLERRVLAQRPARDEEDDQPDLPNHYTVKVGDVCFVAVGQIVGRRYRAVRYQPTAIIVVNSPVESKDLRERVRALWSSKDPAQTLLNTLLMDYATEGIFNGKSLDGWHQGSDLQVSAAMRLLYYFPKESASLIAARLRSFDVQKAESADDRWMKREVKNGVGTVAFIKAVAWCTAPAIQDALADIAKRTNDPKIGTALEQRRKRNP
jgi:HEAT repeat protein